MRGVKPNTLAEQVAQVLARLAQRDRFTRPGDLVLCTSVGGHLDPSALRRRDTRARDLEILEHPDMPALRFHDLRRVFGTMAAERFDLVNVQAMLGQASITTTQRYLHARPAKEDAAKLTQLIAAGLGVEEAAATTAGGSGAAETAACAT